MHPSQKTSHIPHSPVQAKMGMLTGGGRERRRAMQKPSSTPTLDGRCWVQRRPWKDYGERPRTSVSSDRQASPSTDEQAGNLAGGCPWLRVEPNPEEPGCLGKAQKELTGQVLTTEQGMVSGSHLLATVLVALLTCSAR